MMTVIETASRHSADVAPIGTGFYTVPEAARLTRIPARNINRWLGGYVYASRGEPIRVPPLWTPELPRADDHIELGFRDLIELRFVAAFTAAGLGLKTIRNCLEYAGECAHDERPFSTRRFQTDGKTIFLDSLRQSGEIEVLDLKGRQYVFRDVIEATFKDLDLDNDIVARWRPYRGKETIVIDPLRSFGQPIAAESGVPTVALADAVRAEGSIQRVARFYEVAETAVRDAVEYENLLAGA